MKRIAGVVVLFLGVFTAQAFAQRSVVFPHLTNGSGWSSEFFFANQGLSDAYGVEIIFYDNNGNAMTVPTNLGTASSIPFDLNAGTTKMIKTIPTGLYQEGYAVVYYPLANAPIRATEVYRYESGGVVSVQVGVPQQEYHNNFSFPVEMNSASQILTAIALANPFEFANMDQSVVVNLIRTDGVIQDTAVVTLPAGQHTAMYLNEAALFPGLDNFVGTVSISAGAGFGLLAIRQDKQAFGGISTDYGPLLKPFTLSSTVIPLPEPNDTTDDAPNIQNSILLSGYMSSDVDVDSFRYVGHAGDVISILCLTESIASYMDPILQVYYDTGEPEIPMIAENDENGLSPNLYPSSEAFLQMALPFDGTYYVVVWDYWGNSGSDIFYQLHVILPN